MSRHYVLYGAGGIGGGIGAQLHRAGHRVELIARGEHFARLRERGLLVATPESRERLRLPVAPSPEALTLDEETVVILTMKSQDTAPALAALRRVAPPGIAVVCAQNGVANERMAARLFDRVYAVLVHMPATFLEPGRIALEAAPVRGVLDAGRYPRGIDETLSTLCRDLESAAFSSRAEEDVMPLKYGKLLMNLGNAVQALCGLEAEMTELTRRLRREAMACFDAAGIGFLTARELHRRSAGRYRLGEVPGAPRQGGSTWQSFVRQRPTIETDYLNGEVCLLGRRFGVPTPCNRAVQQLAAEAIAAGRRPGDTSVAAIEERAAALERHRRP